MANEEHVTAPAKTAKVPAKKTATKSAAKPPAKTATQKTAKVKAAKTEKVKKPKIVRGRFAIPKPEYAAIAVLKQRAEKHQQAVKKSELIRAGIKALAGMSDDALLKTVRALPGLKRASAKAA